MPAPWNDAACHDVAARQFGVLSRKQAVEAGLSRRAIAARVARGEWVVVHPRVYRLRSAPPSWEASLMAAVLWAGRTALVSHRAAARLYSLDGSEDAPIEIGARMGRAQPGIVVHRLRPEDAPRTRRIQRFRVTAPERTLLDLAGVVSLPVAGLAVDDALRRGITTLQRLRDTVEAEGVCGRTGTANLRRLLSVRDPMDELVESVLESRFLRLLRRSGLPLPVPQHEVRVNGELAARLDFAYPELRVAIETHGRRWHEGHERWRRDARRENRLKRLGWLVLVFTWDDVLGEPGRVVAEIREVLDTRGGGEEEIERGRLLLP